MLLKITGTNKETKSSQNEDYIILSREEWLRNFVKQTIFLFKRNNKKIPSTIIKNNFDKITETNEDCITLSTEEWFKYFNK